MTSYTNTFGGYTILPSDPSYLALTLSANTTLAWPTESQTGTNILAKTMDVSPTTGSLTLRLPDATKATPGYAVVFYNPTGTAFTLADNGGGTVISVASGGVYLVTLTSNATVNGTWRGLQLTTGPSTATAAALAGAGLVAITSTLNQSMPASVLTTNYAVTTADRASALIWNGGAGTITLPLGATLGTDFFCFVKGGGSGSVTVQPSGGELIDGQASISVGNTGSTAIVFKSGAWYTISFVQNPTLGYTRVVVDVAGTGNYTLTPSQYTNDLIYLQGVLSGNREIVFPSTVAVYYVENATTGSFSLGVRTGSQSPAVTLAQGARSIIQCDGTNMGVASTQLAFPAFAGNAGRYLRLNAGETALEFAQPAGLPVAAQITTSTTLPAANVLRTVAMSADAQTVTMPDARTLAAGATVVLSNVGSRTFGVAAGNPNLFTNSDFSSGTGWTTGTGWSVASGLATKTAGVQSDLTQAITTTVNVSYIVTFTITTISGGTVTPVFTGSGADALGTARSAPGTYTELIVSNGNTAVGFRGNSTFAGSIDNVSITLAVPPLLAVVPAGGVAEMYVTDVSTAQGTWTVEGVNLAPARTLIDATLTSTLTQTVEVAVRLTDTLSLHFARNASGHPFVFAVDHAPGGLGVGTAVLIVASNLTVEHAFRISNTKAMFKLEGTSSNVFNVTVSGVTCTISTAATAAVFDFATFTGGPFIAALGANSDMFVAIDITGGITVRAQAVDCSGTNPSAGASVNISALGTGSPSLSGVFRVTDTTAVAFYTDDTGSAGTPFSIRAVVLSLSGTTITVNTPAGLNDVISSTGTNGPPVCQHAAGLYTLGYYQASGTLLRAVGVTVSGTTVTFGTPTTVETASLNDQNIGQFNANRFQPNLYPLSGTTALFTYGLTSGSTPSRHVVLTNTAGAITAGTILYGLWTDANGGNFPQASDGFLAFSTATGEISVAQGTINGTAVTVSGSFARSDVDFEASASHRFGLSGGVRGIVASSGTAASRRIGTYNLFRSSPGGSPRFLGAARAIDMDGGAGINIPVEVAPNKAAFTALSASQTGSTTSAIRLAILEFAA